MSKGIKELFRQQEEELQQLELRSEKLRRKYDQYFLGMEKREPGFEREQIDRELQKTKLNRTLNTGLRFRFQQFLARHRTYCAYWDRVLREIEEGTYRRSATTQAERLAARQADAAMARAQGLDPRTGRPSEDPDEEKPPEDASIEGRRLLEAAAQARHYLAQMLADAGDDELDSSDTEAGNRSRCPPATERPAPPEQSADGRATTDGMADLYARYVHAKTLRGEDISRLSYDRFARSVERQREAAREKLGEDVELRVKVTDRKVTLVAARRKG